MQYYIVIKGWQRTKKSETIQLPTLKLIYLLAHGFILQ